MLVYCQSINHSSARAYENASFGSLNPRERVSCRKRQSAEVPCQHKKVKTLQLCLQNLSRNNIERGKRFAVNGISITANFVVPIHLSRETFAVSDISFTTKTMVLIYV